MAKLRKLGYGWLILSTYNQKYDLQSFPTLVTISCKEFKDTDWFPSGILMIKESCNVTGREIILVC